MLQKFWSIFGLSLIMELQNNSRQMYSDYRMGKLDNWDIIGRQVSYWRFALGLTVGNRIEIEKLIWLTLSQHLKSLFQAFRWQFFVRLFKIQTNVLYFRLLTLISLRQWQSLLEVLGRTIYWILSTKCGKYCRRWTDMLDEIYVDIIQGIKRYASTGKVNQLRKFSMKYDVKVK